MLRPVSALPVNKSSIIELDSSSSDIASLEGPELDTADSRAAGSSKVRPLFLEIESGHVNW
jgi:BRCA1/BRCA2-containing complex subunit 3